MLEGQHIVWCKLDFDILNHLGMNCLYVCLDGPYKLTCKATRTIPRLYCLNNVIIF